MTNGAWSPIRDRALRDAAATIYERNWEPVQSQVNRRLLDALRVAERSSVLQLAAGPGAAAIAAAYAVGDYGRVLGLDASPAMVELARAKALGMNLKQIQFEQGDPERPRLSADSFDAAFCGLDLAFLSHPEQTVAALRVAVKPGSRVAVAVPGAAGRCPVLGFLSAALDAHLPEPRRAPLHDPFALAQEGALAALMTNAGLQNVEVRSAGFMTEFASEEEYADTIIAVAGRTAAALEGADPGVIEALRYALAEALAPYALPRSFRLQNEFLYAVGVK